MKTIIIIMFLFISGLAFAYYKDVTAGDQWQADYQYTEATVQVLWEFDLEDIEVGLRSDGVLVWKMGAK